DQQHAAPRDRVSPKGGAGSQEPPADPAGVRGDPVTAGSTRPGGKSSPEPAIATTTAIPIAALEAVRAAASPKKSLLGDKRDEFPVALARRGRGVEVFEHSGDLLGTVFLYLEEKRGIDLIHSRHDELASAITKARGSTFFILGEEHLALADELTSVGA